MLGSQRSILRVICFCMRLAVGLLPLNTGECRFVTHRALQDIIPIKGEKGEFPMTEKMGGRVPQDLPPDSDTTAAVNKTKAQLVAEAKAEGIKVPSKATKAEVQALLEANQADSGSDDSDQATDADEAADQATDEASTDQSEPSVGLFDDIDQTDTADVNSDDSGEVSDDADQTPDDSDESDDTDEADQAADESDDTDEAPVGLVTDQDSDEAHQATDESDDTDEADQATDESDDTDEADQAADESDGADEQPVVDLSHVPPTGHPEDFVDADEQPVNPDVQPEWSDEGVAPGSTVFVAPESPADSVDDSTATDHVSLADKAAFRRVNFGSRRTRVIIIGLVALAALIAAMVVISSSTDNGDSDDVVTPAVTVDEVFSGLCETEGEVDLTTMPVVGFSLDGLNTDGTDDAATVQSRVVDDYFVDTSLGCSSQGIEFLRTGVDQARIDADRLGLDTRDSAGRIAYNSDNPEEALVVAGYLNKVMSECAAEMVVLTEADIQDGLYVLTFTDGSYGDLIWVKMPVETALSGVSSIEVMSCTIGLVEGSDGLTRSFMYSEGLGTFVSVETPFGNTVEYVPAPVEETGAEPVTVTDEPEAPEANDTEAETAEDEAETVEEPKDTSGEEAEQAEEPAPTPDPEEIADDPPKADPPKADPPKADPPKADPPKADPPKADPPKADPPKADPPKADPPKADEPEVEEPKAEESSDDTATETPAEDTEQTTEVKPDTPADDPPAEIPAGPVDAGDGGTIPSTSGDGGCNGTCGGPNEDGSSGGTIPGDGGGGGCVGVCVGQGGNDGSQGGCVSDCPGNGGSQGGCNVDCNGGDEPEDTPEPEETPEEDPEEVPEEDPKDDECAAPNTLDAFGNCKAPPREGAVDL